MKKRRKHHKCLNCGYQLKESHNYCPQCGQENTDNNAGLSILFNEFISNFFSVDSRFGRTLKPFLFNPGKITKDFIEGKRMKYANPVRWYLVISLFHFFFFSWIVNDNNEEGNSTGFVFSNSNDYAQSYKGMSREKFDSLYYLPDSLHVEDWPMPKHYEQLLAELVTNDSLTTTMIMDSLNVNELPYLRKRVVRQMIRLEKESSKGISEYIFGQFPIIIFCILPLYAFILKLFYWKKYQYFEHLIHSFHIHSFVLFVLGISYIFILIFGENLKNIAPIIAAILSAAYVLMSLKNNYNINWGWTIARYLMIGFIYMITLAASMAVGLFLSLIFF